MKTLFARRIKETSGPYKNMVYTEFYTEKGIKLGTVPVENKQPRVGQKYHMLNCWKYRLVWVYQKYRNGTTVINVGVSIDSANYKGKVISYESLKTGDNHWIGSYTVKFKDLTLRFAQRYLDKYAIKI